MPLVKQTSWTTNCQRSNTRDISSFIRPVLVMLAAALDWGFRFGYVTQFGATNVSLELGVDGAGPGITNWNMDHRHTTTKGTKAARRPFPCQIKSGFTRGVEWNYSTLFTNMKMHWVQRLLAVDFNNHIEQESGPSTDSSVVWRIPEHFVERIIEFYLCQVDPLRRQTLDVSESEWNGSVSHVFLCVSVHMKITLKDTSDGSYIFRFLVVADWL